MEIIYDQNDNLVTLSGLRDEQTEEYIADATVGATVKDKYGVAIAGQDWPLVMDYVTGSDGNYQGVLEAALEVDVGEKVTVEVTVDAGNGREAFFAVPAVVRQRGKNY